MLTISQFMIFLFLLYMLGLFLGFILGWALREHILYERSEKALEKRVEDLTNIYGVEESLEKEGG
ncbi:MAG: hypothetical protein ACTSR0_04130 [Candidatus Asgardarchaeia archaeon]